ncbi:IS1634 family transposase [Nostoc sp. 'Peltigera membranacea cyanobiont' N6]|uniref:IS1634 family transposase n=1 Tax=Nostoc sp. 'Peltigera membranacea cyanobiont' N6 TaxID=1261031 RepID=UPI000CF32FAA|nr:IS1634 family transposase [Nostoc sp. 'Peltigera membranacea cyanobiont' N6]AVH62575.1 transposase [Nostoc sp. 'Peltigera membranacea cyanobiont' N6]AVH63478.1 transposase [Nostoc sp. 'Peltigera membranacea cyanobiont' N6]AVH63597.1 transposase [Nostoc sp. 'Peltigera membranacea cyanobiont' N6]AVH63790.1 transposase [Nostoc sp. 'Peltigera membranacea cyanobiont' N6]AVH63829.1 transposase [Nostoc sp. 'Peltigera membranacea cyanobiont' N6]
MDYQKKEIGIKNLDHLGIVAGLIDEIGIVETINSKLGIDGREKISSGTVVKAILINGLGFVSRPLYLFSQFFEDKGIENLLGCGVKSDYINDDKIGRVMDELYKYGLNSLFIEIVLSVINKFKIETKYSHLDATSFHLHGEYTREKEQEKEAEIIKEKPIIITKGYSRDHRPDLKQCVLDLITSSDGDIPLLMRVGDGNEADKAVFGKILVEFKKQINFESIMVCDSALYSQENIKLIEHLKWITRVPMTIKRAKELVQSVEIEEIDSEEIEKRRILNLDGYKWKEEIVNYGGIKQIWLIVESQKRQKSDLEKLEKNLKAEKNKVEKLLNQLKKEDFQNPDQARYKLKSINKKLKFFEIQEAKLIDKTSKNKTIYKIEGVDHQKLEEIAMIKKEAGRFILATNLVEDEKLKSSEIITNYKNQQSCERGFRFLKNPLFFTDSFFVENPERIETMLFLMSLCLLVYNLGQRELRNSLKRANIGVKNQLGKLTKCPTLKWIFQCFQGIHILTLNGVNQIVNLTQERNFILNFLPVSCQKYYLIS